MCRVSLLVLVCAALVDAAVAACTVSKYDDGFGQRLKCSNVTSLSDVIHYDGLVVRDVMIFQSYIRSIPDRSFLRYAKSLISLTMHGCGIGEISDDAFNGMTHLRKLGLPHNNITSVRERWFVALPLEQLDLSYNLIQSIEPTVFERLRGLKRLDVTGNRLTCLEPIQLAPMAGIDKIRFAGNPLTFRCRGTLTLWLQDLGVNYKSGERGEDSWLDSVLWLCAAEDGKIADSEVLMKECVILNLFNQLRTGLTTAESFPLSLPQECAYARNELTRCVAADRKRGREVITNGHVVRKLLRQLEESKSTTGIDR